MNLHRPVACADDLRRRKSIKALLTSSVSMNAQAQRHAPLPR